ncbi:protein of unknown function DUF324 [Staphylothermus hellenicus DSM 12710]|uniref:CRISPR system Cms protein Csm4 n=1 Tax=Staphylothermus hellenicus (strain DSM 12710 / JCM 10830 / BK20S6-10-b1 / P8) TaxID=591019 RepID=D7DBU1_STAHD|nr:protein of unknown function DUF324 [Staphylothermus hellenicus DSM 12710]
MIEWYKIYFETPVHIGERGVGVESVNKLVPSTTIWSALIYSMIQLGILDSREDFSNLFRVNTLTPIINSEPMFWINGLNTILYNKIIQLINNTESHNPLKVFNDTNNILKNTILASTNLLKHDISKCILEARESRDEAGNIELKLQCGTESFYFSRLKELGYALTSNKEEPRNILKIDRRPKNIIDRITSSATPYHLSVVIYNVPLLLGIEILDNNISRKDIEASLRLLSDLGIGGERTHGFGKFTYEHADLEILDNNDGSYRIIQGLYFPGTQYLEKILNEEAYYNIKIHGYRSGFAGYPRKPVFTLSEGSIIPSEKYVKGLIIVDQRYGDRVVRSFDPITFRIKLSCTGD